MQSRSLGANCVVPLEPVASAWRSIRRLLHPQAEERRHPIALDAAPLDDQEQRGIDVGALLLGQSKQSSAPQGSATLPERERWLHPPTRLPPCRPGGDGRATSAPRAREPGGAATSQLAAARCAPGTFVAAAVCVCSGRGFVSPVVGLDAASLLTRVRSRASRRSMRMLAPAAIYSR